MPTQENSEALPSGNEAKAESPSATLESEVLATDKTSSGDTEQLTKSEALAIAWTGIEALARMGAANLYRSRTGRRVVIELLATNLTADGGLTDRKD